MRLAFGSVRATSRRSASARRVYLDLSLWGSGFGRGWVLSDARSDGLQVLLEMRRDGRLNFADLARRWKQTAPPSTPEAAPPRITVNHLVASDGVLTYRELSEEPAATKILPVRIELEDVSTLPDHEGQYSVFARFADGGVLKWRGDLTLQPLQSEGDLDLQGLKLATVWKFLREDLRLAEPAGQLDIAGHYKFEHADGKPKLTLTGIRADVAEVSVTREEASDPMLALKSLSVRDASFQLDRRTLEVPAVTLSSGHLVLLTQTDGTLNWAGLVRPAAASSAEQATPAADAKPDRNAGASPWVFNVREVNVDNVALRYRDRQRPLDLQAASLDGTAALEVTVGQSVNIVTREMDLGLQKVRLGNDSPPVQLALVRMQGGFLDLAQRRFGASQILVDGGVLDLERGADGALSVVQNLTPQDKASSASQPWRYAIDQLRVQKLDVAFSDLSFGKPLAVPVSGVSVRIGNIVSGSAKPMNVKASGSIATGGSVEANGTLAQNFERLDATVNVKGVALTPLQPLIARYAAVDLASGSAAVNATLRYRQAGKPAFIAQGGFALANVRLNEAGSKTRVLAWKRMSARDARLTLGSGPRVDQGNRARRARDDHRYLGKARNQSWPGWSSPSQPALNNRQPQPRKSNSALRSRRNFPSASAMCASETGSSITPIAAWYCLFPRMSPISPARRPASAPAKIASRPCSSMVTSVSLAPSTCPAASTPSRLQTSPTSWRRSRMWTCLRCRPIPRPSSGAKWTRASCGSQ